MGVSGPVWECCSSECWLSFGVMVVLSLDFLFSFSSLLRFLLLTLCVVLFCYFLFFSVGLFS